MLELERKKVAIGGWGEVGDINKECEGLRYALHSIDMHFIVIDLRRSSWSPVDELVADVNFPIGPSSKTPMHTITEMVSPKMVVVLLDHHVDANIHIMEDMTPLDILITLTSNFILDNPTHIEP
ncbi:hypothetical protein JHK84_044987 [Glycine max]|nr:hypothetical protein JHK86_044874 [Glycine max]KAG4951623.1 hypothetical protein JHK85_045490 [Glycine max]KAG5108080.1 hypothetical protein JHK84_044987 [Glycine max]